MFGSNFLSVSVFQIPQDFDTVLVSRQVEAAFIPHNQTLCNYFKFMR